MSELQSLITFPGILAAVTFTVLSVIGLLIAEFQWSPGKSRRYVWVFKPLASIGFLITAFVAGALQSVFGLLIFGSLLLGAIGDVLLIPENNKKVFMAGMASFLLGHVGYCVAFLYLEMSPSDAILAGSIMMLVSAAVLRWLWPHVSGFMRPILVGYVTIFSVMVAVAAGVCAERQMSLLIIAASIFVISDILTARQRFVRPQFINRLISLPLYYAAQLLFAVSVAIM